MLLDILFLILGLVLILSGANFMTDGASYLAKKWGMSDLVIGLTVVAFGTSAPELVISVMSAIQGNAGIAIGNVVGSNIFNVCAIIGITALVTPIKITKSIMTNDIPLVILSSLVLLVMGNSTLLNGAQINILDRTDGIILLLFFLIFMRYTFASAKREENLPAPDSSAPAEVESAEVIGTPIEKKGSLWKAVIWVVGGLAALIFGGDWFVDGASGIASSLGVSDAVIGLTIVAAGTSLPELATSVAAALKGKTGIAIGNVIGSNIFNIFMVLGCSATIHTLPFGTVGNLDLIVLTASSVLFWIFGWFFKKRTITRPEGAILLITYIAYITYLVVNS